MTCTNFGNIMVCHHPTHKLRLEDGRNVWFDFHPYGGFAFFKDRRCLREIENWWDDPAIKRPLDWYFEKYLKR